MHINEFFSHTYLVNLDRRTDRLSEFVEQSKKYNISYERISAVDGSKLDIKPGRPPHVGWSVISMGNLGNVLSQRTILEDAIKNNYDSVLIFEDDVQFHDEFTQLCSEYLENVPYNWDMIYFGGNHQSPLKPISDSIGICEFTLTAHAVGIKRHMYEHILYETELLNVPIDLSYAMLHKVHNVYSPLKPLIWQSSGFSDIEERNVDYSTILK